MVLAGIYDKTWPGATFLAIPAKPPSVILRR
jgi:hypothetical protein